MTKVLFGLFLLIISVGAQAYIPKASMILTRMAENSGKGAYLIEQEVQFPNGADTVAIREHWLIEGENNMRLYVVGSKELKDLFSFQVSYINGTRNQSGQTSRLGEDFIEKYFNIRTPEAFAQILASMKVVPSSVLAKKTLKNLKDAEIQPESFVHLSRVSGVVAYALGPIATSLDEQKPGFWIEQDQFLLRKFRLPSMVEVSADKYNNYGRGLSYPGTRNVRWNNQQITIQTISVKAVGKDTVSSFISKNNSTKMNLGQIPAAALIEEFYKRFR